jgi:lipopolysaccharide export LptBFGC system permease protein LptF
MAQKQAQDSSHSKISKIALAIALFAIGFFTACFFNALPSSLEQPYSLLTSNEVQAPSDFIKEDSIWVYDDKIVINVDNASLSKYAPTGSMIPLFNEGANGIRIKPKTAAEINLGDIVSYEKGSELIVHRVVEIGTDEEGVYFITKGDNNSFSDGKVRFEQIKYLTIGILY